MRKAAGMRAALTFLARHRWAGVGSALLAELVLLVPLSLAPPASTIGIPAAVAAAIAGTVAVVFGVAAGVAVVTAGAVTFAALGGWEPGQLAALGVWPLIVTAVGLFARRVERHRVALHDLVESQEDERRALALTLHDDSAQTLTGALLTLRAGAQTAQARELITDTIRQLRRLALELSPKALEDYGLAAALGHLAETETALGDTPVRFESAWDGRLSAAAESALFRVAQAALAVLRDCGASPIAIRLDSDRGPVALTIGGRSAAGAATEPRLPDALEERVRLLGGRVSVTASGDGELVLHAEVPVGLQLVEHVA